MTTRKRTFHGHCTGNRSGSPEYRTWSGMVDRCENPKNKSYPIYGGKGVRVSEEWRADFSAFFRDMGQKPTPSHSIERINSGGNYEAGNCRWASRKEQGNNTSRNKIVVLDGREMTLAQACDLRGMHYPTVKSRMLRGMSIEEALEPRHLKKKLDEKIVREIMASSDGHAALGRRFGVTAQAILSVRKGETWTYVTGLSR